MAFAGKTQLLTTGFLLAATGAAMAQPAQPQPAATFPINMAAPSVTIANGIVTAKIFTPIGEKGFYNGTRFDQAGVVGSLTMQGREFYGPWYDSTAPEVLDYVLTPKGIVAGPDSAVTGPVDEFNTDGKGLGYDLAPVGGRFIKIGVGILIKPDAKPYDHYWHYVIADHGKRTTATTANSVTFTQDIDDRQGSGYAYSYEKTLRLVPGKPQMVIEHSLKNTGPKPIVSTVYDHNFLRLAWGNENLVISMPFTPQLTPPSTTGLLAVEGNKVRYLRPVADGERASHSITGYGANASDYDFTVTDTKTGGAVRVQGDNPVTRVNTFSVPNVMAVEPYNNLDIAPGQTARWSYTYTYTAKAP